MKHVRFVSIVKTTTEEIPQMTSRLTSLHWPRRECLKVTKPVYKNLQYNDLKVTKPAYVNLQYSYMIKGNKTGLRKPAILLYVNLQFSYMIKGNKTGIREPAVLLND
jgi:hypothetical protein